MKNDERCGCNCRVCLEKVYEGDQTIELDEGDTFCPGPCHHTDEERSHGFLSMLIEDDELVKEMFEDTE